MTERGPTNWGKDSQVKVSRGNLDARLELWGRARGLTGTTQEVLHRVWALPLDWEGIYAAIDLEAVNTYLFQFAGTSALDRPIAFASIASAYPIHKENPMETRTSNSAAAANDNAALKAMLKGLIEETIQEMMAPKALPVAPVAPTAPIESLPEVDLTKKAPAKADEVVEEQAPSLDGIANTQPVFVPVASFDQYFRQKDGKKVVDADGAMIPVEHHYTGRVDGLVAYNQFFLEADSESSDRFEWLCALGQLVDRLITIPIINGLPELSIHLGNYRDVLGDAKLYVKKAWGRFQLGRIHSSFWAGAKTRTLTLNTVVGEITNDLPAPRCCGWYSLLFNAGRLEVKELRVSKPEGWNTWPEEWKERHAAKALRTINNTHNHVNELILGAAPVIYAHPGMKSLANKVAKIFERMGMEKDAMLADRKTVIQAHRQYQAVGAEMHQAVQAGTWTPAPRDENGNKPKIETSGLKVKVLKAGTLAPELVDASQVIGTFYVDGKERIFRATQDGKMPTMGALNQIAFLASQGKVFVKKNPNA